MSEIKNEVTPENKDKVSIDLMELLKMDSVTLNNSVKQKLIEEYYKNIERESKIVQKGSCESWKQFFCKDIGKILICIMSLIIVVIFSIYFLHCDSSTSNQNKTQKIEKKSSGS